MKTTNCFLVCVTISLIFLASCSNSTSSGDTATPNAPTNLLVANIDASSVKLTWTDASNNENGFKITRWSYKSGSGTTITVSANITTYTDTGLVTYQYRYSVCAYNSRGESDPTPSVDIWVGSPIAAPSNLIAKSVDSHSISLTWSQNSSSLKYFTVEKSPSPSSPFSTVGTTSSTSCTDTGCTAKSTYRYRVFQTSSQNVESGYSNVDSATTMDEVAPPSNLSTSWSGSGFLLTWTASTTPNVTYAVMRRGSGQSVGSVLATGISTTYYSDATAASGVGYYYSVKAVADGTNPSAYTNGSESITPLVYNEVEPNGPTTSLTTVDWSYYRERATANKELLIINGGYSGAYAGYSAATYKYYDWDLFELTFDNQDIVKIEVLKGTTSGLWGMGLSLTMDMSATSGGTTPLSPGNPTIVGNTYTWNIFYSGFDKLSNAYLTVSMPDNLVNSGPYSYQLEITITRK